MTSAQGSNARRMTLGRLPVVFGRCACGACTSLRRGADRGLLERFRCSLRGARRNPGACTPSRTHPTGRRGSPSSEPRRPPFFRSAGAVGA